MVKKAIAAFFTVLVLSSALTACNTTRGIGEDISDGGSAISGQQPRRSNKSIVTVQHAVVPSFFVSYTARVFANTLRDDL